MHELARYIAAQEGVIGNVLLELRSGQKRTHWMWFVFPQIDGLGRSEIAKCYAIKNIEEAREYLAHPLLGERLRTCTEIVLAIEDRDISEIFGYPDDLKFKSCMTLFEAVAEPDSSFAQALDKYFDGERDLTTLALLSNKH